ncbi:phosphoglycerate dehydrogenase [Micrococcales bacterium 31B]|nr:phosphoglycerate dehydrogenase [Micrococcales bacterium 31B]
MPVSKPVVLIAEELSPATVEALGDGFDIRSTNGADRQALLRDVVDANALLVRSATQVDDEVFAAAKHLQVVARAGVGLDNVNVPAATKAGVMVVNAPTSNIVSAAELAITLMLASMRNVATASASLKQGEWKRSKFTGVEMYEKTVGIVGLGRIGLLVAQRLAPFDVSIVAYDPYISSARAAQIGVKLLSLDELMQVSDVITVHLPKTPETVDLISDEQFALAKPGLHIVNAARGGIINEAALYTALKEGKIAGAGLDVFDVEPPHGNPLLTLENVVVTPHLGASTHEAQEKAGIAVAKSVRLALAGELVPDAVNVSGGVIADEVRPGIDLADKLGQAFRALAAETAINSIDVEVRGEIASLDVKVLELAALRGLLRNVVSEQVSYVNAPVIATERNIDVRLLTDPQSPEFRNVVTVRGTLVDGRIISITGTLAGTKQVQKLVGINEFSFDVPLSQHMLVFGYADRPGMIGQIGTLMGENEINIAGMQVARNTAGGEALVVLEVDSVVPAEIVAEIGLRIGAGTSQAVNLQE